MKKIIIMIVLLASIGNISALTHGADGLGVFTVNCTDEPFNTGGGISLLYSNTPFVEDIWIDCYTESISYYSGGSEISPCHYYWNGVKYYSGYYSGGWQYQWYPKLNIFGGGNCQIKSNGAGICILTASITLIVSNASQSQYTVSGTLECVDSVQLFIRNNNMEYIRISEERTDVDYSFTITENCTYKLIFSDDYEYIFECSGNEICTYNACSFMTINLQDYCGNTMTNTSVDIYKSDGGNMASYNFVGTYLRINPIQIAIDIDVEEGKMLDIYFDTDMGDYHVIDFCEEKTIDVLHPTKTWSLSLGAFDDVTLVPIPNMRCVANQTCKIDPDHPLKQFLFTGNDGYGTFIGISAQPIDIYMGNPSYFGSEFFVDPFGDAFHTHCTLDTYFNATSPEIIDDGNQTDNVSLGCAIWFNDQTGKRDRHINDTDVYVDLYYENKNCTSTLKFQRLYASYWMTKQSWNIPINESGHKRIYNTDFSVADANYRAVMYAEECECNCTLSLYVTNQTVEEEQHYENLSAHCRFKHQIGAGQVDYRSPVDISTYAYTNYSHTLLNINLTLYETCSIIATKQCNWADYAGASPKWLYVWSPNVEYDVGKNYTIVMTGYDGFNLDADDVWTSNIRNNKLTVRVRDNHNAPIAYSSVFVQGWGSEALGSQTSLTIEGFLDQSYQYKATKSGYTSSGWDTANFSGDDEIVTCVLIKSATESVSGYKLKDAEIKSFFIPLMYLLFIMILIGGLTNAAKK